MYYRSSTRAQRTHRELQALATQLHQNVEIRDRKYHLKNYKNCFVGHVRQPPQLRCAFVVCIPFYGAHTHACGCCCCWAALRCVVLWLSTLLWNKQDAVTWMVKSGWAVNRADAVFKGRLLVRARYIHHVVNNHDFADSTLFFRFYADESKRCAITWAHVCVCVCVCVCVRAARSMSQRPSLLHFPHLPVVSVLFVWNGMEWNRIDSAQELVQVLGAACVRRCRRPPALAV